MTSRAEMLWTPAELGGLEVLGRIVVVVDVLRATTSILAALEAGARVAIPAESTEEALRLARSLGRESVLLCGEREGKRIEGYDLGNSPLEYTPERVRGRTLVYNTTNGTRAIRRVSGAGEVMLACFRNLGAVVERLCRFDTAPIVVCAGREEVVSLDDALCAGLLLRRCREAGIAAELGDGALAGVELAGALGAPTADLLGRTAAGRALLAIGYGRDVAYCAEVDASSGVAVLGEDGLVLAGANP